MRQNIILIVYMILSAYELRAVFILFAFIICYINLNRLETGEDKYWLHSKALLHSRDHAADLMAFPTGQTA